MGDEQRAAFGQRIVKLAFDPSKHTDVSEVFADDIARTLWLLWRPGHIVGQDFGALCLQVAGRIRKVKPQTCDELRKCFPTLHDYWTEMDVGRFCESSLPWFTGAETISYEVVTK